MAFHRRPTSAPVAALLVVCLAATNATEAAQVLRYTFDDGDFSGTGMAGSPWVLNDSAAPATNATASGTLGGTNISPSQPGVFGKAWRFTSDSTGATAADYENLMVVPAGTVPSGSAERTISTWFNQTVDTPQQDKLFGYGGTAGGTAFDVSLEGGVRLRHFGGNILYGAGTTFFPGGTNPGWNHLAVRVNPGATTFANVDVFFNGTQLGAGAGATGATINTTNSTFGIGTSTITASGTITHGFTGLLDEFHVYDNALTSADIAQLAVLPLLTLTLEVQTDTGRAFIRNNSAQPYDVDFYSVKSADAANGSLIPANLNPLQTMNLSAFPGGDGSGNGWEVGGGSNETELGEAYLTGTSTFAPGMTPLGIGAIYDVADSQELSFSYRSSGSMVTGQVIYTTAGVGVAEDCNRSGLVEAVDLSVWSENFGSRNILANDTTPGTVDGTDFLLWQRRLDATSSVPATATVPESSTAALLMTGGLLVACVRARRQ